MSAGIAARIPGCRLINITRSVIFQYQYPLQSSCSEAVRPCRLNLAVVPKTQKRGKKTKTIVQATALPQGQLPPLQELPLSETSVQTYPPVLQQHLQNVKKYQGCIVLTRVGDFYEMYFDQVEEYAPLVNLKKAKRSTAIGDVSMAGFQYTQLERYLKMFVIDLGKPVAISEQFPISESERASRPRGQMFDRRVSRVVTAGTLVDESFLDAFESNYLLCIQIDEVSQPTARTTTQKMPREYSLGTTKVGLSWVDLSNGDFFTQESSLAFLPSLVARIKPREIVLDPSMETQGDTVLSHLFSEGDYSIHYHKAEQTMESIEDWTTMLEQAMPVIEQESFTKLEILAGSLVLDYIRIKLPEMEVRLQAPTRRLDSEYMTIDKQSLKGLEIRTTLRDGHFQGSLLHSVRRTVTKSGARLLGQRLVSPSLSLPVIDNRLDLVEHLVGHNALREDIVALLRRTSDTFRLLQSFSIGRGDADDLLGLARTVEVMTQISTLLHDHINVVETTAGTWRSRSGKPGFLWHLLDRLDLVGPAKVVKTIFTTIDEEGLSQKHGAEDEARAQAEEMSIEVENSDAAGDQPPRLVRRVSTSRPSKDTIIEDIWIMRKQASPTLTQAHDRLANLQEERQELLLQLRAELKAESLTLKWSGSLGHHCHVKGKDMKRSITSLNGARETGSSKSSKTFHHPDWSLLGTNIEEAKHRIRAEETRVFRKLRALVIENLMTLRRNAAILDELDVACSSATVAKERNLVRPIITEQASHKIIGGRHPTVDVGLSIQGRSFTGNDCLVGDSARTYLITGPNMAGKSTYLRQNALITILAQTGCFVPATHAELGLVDRVFSRVGSADNLYQDQSTFMLEMLETAAILTHATPRSLVIMDEVGRGTTPDDGLAVAYASLHHLHHVTKCRTLFATHFHELARMTESWDSLGCFCTDVVEQEDGRWAYLHRLREGVNWRSHALKVAALAGMPTSAIAVAEGVVAELGRRKNASSERASGLPVLGVRAAS